MRGMRQRMHACIRAFQVRAVYIWMLLLVSVVTLGSSSIYAAQEGNVYDDAALLTESERSSLNNKISALKEESGWNIYAVTTADAGGKTATEYADDFFDIYSPEQEDGVVLLIDMDNREITISTCGIAIRYLTDDRIEYILDDAYTDVSNGNYGDCLDTMLNGVAQYYRAGIPENQYNYDTETGKVSRYHTLSLGEILIAVVLAVACGGAIYGVVIGKYRLKFDTYQYAFREYGKVNLRIKEDRFVNQTVTHRRIPKQTSNGSSHGSSGRSSTHRSSSGRSHGGGSRKF